MNRISDNNIDCKSYFDYIVNNERLIHFESLLIAKIDVIKSDFDRKICTFSLSTMVTFLLTVFGFSSDTIAMKLIKTAEIFKNINEGVVNCIYLIFPILLLVETIKLKRIRKSLDLEFLKDPYTQDKLFHRFILDKYYKEILVDVNNVIKSLKCYYENDMHTSIKFLKCDFKIYVRQYLEENFKGKIDFDVSRYLCEVIILRKLIENEIYRLQDSNEYFEIIISKNSDILFKLTGT
ncbi:hypothetical protein [Clostridium oceanicum]|uniref:SMODS and SLOG-associating 2TM effector domain-containing protein n=1 Tax=Clostridium oceanicum TaxID=1543 RepID=A0ABP3UUZ3_9CLOT